MTNISHKLRLGTRGSKLAMAQAERAKASLEFAHPALDVEIVTIKTSGDRGERERVGAFVHEIQEAILDGRVDVGLHCLKDLPVDPVPGLTLAAHLKREDPRDGLIGSVTSVGDLPKDAVVGTGSVRRTSQLANVRSDLSFRPLVGNVDTRLRKLIAGEYDAILLAVAGLKRLGLLDAWRDSEYAALSVTPLSSQEMLPAPGQAVLVLETREGDGASQAFVSFFEHAETRACATAERAFLKVFGGGCSMPIASFAVTEGDEMNLTGLVASPDGSKIIRGSLKSSAADPAGVAHALAEQLAGEGAWDLLQLAGATR